MWRAGFGISLPEMQETKAWNEKKLYRQMEKNSLQAVTPLIIASEPEERIPSAPKPDIEERRRKQKQSRSEISQLNLLWLNEMVNSPAQLREKMALFWHGHFACRIQNSYFQQLLLQEIRSHALAKFGDLLRAVSKSASMLSFLNNQQNKKKHPNENFAREVMELFTLGRGHYSEEDIKEAARAFTGWGFDPQGNSSFRKKQHDTGTKTVLGKTGNFDGDEILDILLQQKQTSVFLTEKIYRYFVNEEPDKERVKELAERFYQNDYDIAALMRDIFTSNWFYEEKNIGAQIKSPVQLLAGIQRALPMKIQNEQIFIVLQRALGQLLFYPPNVAGWPGGKAWIDSSTLLLRMNLPVLIKEDTPFYLDTKPDYDDPKVRKQRNRKEMNKGYRILADIDWDQYAGYFKKTSSAGLYESIAGVLLQANPDSFDKRIVERESELNDRIEYIRSVSIRLMSTPEYQLC